MKLFDDLRNYVLEEQFKMIYLDNKVNIVNYKSIEHFDSNKVMIKTDKCIVTIKGQHLIVSRLLNDEILVEGSIDNIEFR